MQIRRNLPTLQFSFICLSTQHIFDVRNSSAAGSLLQVEVNYGVLPDIQLYIVIPLTYQFSSPHDFEMGYTATDAGIKYRFVKERKNLLGGTI
jgi:hypothetical protein